MLWRAGDVIYRAYSQRLAKSELTLCRLRPGDLRLTDCQFLYLDQRHPESRDVPGSGSRAWGRVVLCRRERIVRRLCGVRRAVA